MLTIDLALILVFILIAFIVAWHWMPSGWLTATTGSLSAIIIAFHEAMGGLMADLKMALPDEYRPWLIVLFLLLTVAARFRRKAQS